MWTCWSCTTSPCWAREKCTSCWSHGGHDVSVKWAEWERKRDGGVWEDDVWQGWETDSTDWEQTWECLQALPQGFQRHQSTTSVQTAARHRLACENKFRVKYGSFKFAFIRDRHNIIRPYLRTKLIVEINWNRTAQHHNDCTCEHWFLLLSYVSFYFK